MSNQPVLTDLEREAIEAALGALVPVRGRIDRDRVMFQAGQAAARSSRPGRQPWIAIAASLALIALGEAALLAHRPSPRVVERVVVVRQPSPIPLEPADEPIAVSSPRPKPDADPPSLGRTDRERLAALVVRYGLDGLPASPRNVWPESRPWPASSGRMLHAELRKLLEPGDPS